MKYTGMTSAAVISLLHNMKIIGNEEYLKQMQRNVVLLN